jgi:hypothetical protein
VTEKARDVIRVRRMILPFTFDLAWSDCGGRVGRRADQGPCFGGVTATAGVGSVGGVGMVGGVGIVGGIGGWP